MKIDAALLDTNILLRAQASEDAEHLPVVKALRWCADQQVSLFVSTQSLHEMWAVLTRPQDANGYGLSAAEAAERVRAVKGLFGVLPEHPAQLDRWLDLCEQYAVLGRQAHDARLVAAMLCYEITNLITLNKRDFIRFQSEIFLFHPEELIIGGE